MARRLLLAAAPLLAALALLLAGCGSEGTVSPLPKTVEGTVEQPTEPPPGPKGDPAAGKSLFAEQACGTCHTLKAAGTSGTIGPNLDQSKPSVALSVERIANGKGSMPAYKDKLSAQQIADIAAYVVESTQGG